MMTVLHTKDTDNSMYVVDGALNLFGNHFNNDADIDDARKLSNVNENLSACGGTMVIYQLKERNWMQMQIRFSITCRECSGKITSSNS